MYWLIRHMNIDLISSDIHPQLKLSLCCREAFAT